jgi:hypothetical protein
MFLVVPRGKLVGEPLVDDAQRLFIAGLFHIAPHAEQADAMGPFPSVPALGVDDPSIVEMQQEFSGLSWIDTRLSIRRSIRPTTRERSKSIGSR